jgi:hypothetical protein
MASMWFLSLVGSQCAYQRSVVVGFSFPSNAHDKRRLVSGLLRREARSIDRPLDEDFTDPQVNILRLQGERLSGLESCLGHHLKERCKSGLDAIGSRQEHGDLRGRERPDLCESLSLIEPICPLLAGTANLVARVREKKTIFDGGGEDYRESRPDQTHGVLPESRLSLPRKVIANDRPR